MFRYYKIFYLNHICDTHPNMQTTMESTNNIASTYIVYEYEKYTKQGLSENELLASVQ